MYVHRDTLQTQTHCHLLVQHYQSRFRQTHLKGTHQLVCHHDRYIRCSLS